MPIGSNGRVYGSTTANGVKVDPSRVLTNFNQNIPTPTAPGGTAYDLGAYSSGSLPRAGDTPQANGRYLYTTSGIAMSGNKTVTISGPVDIVVTGDMTMSGNSQITVSGTTASLAVYGNGNLQVGGNGVSNTTSVPSNVTFCGVGTSGTNTVSIGGNGTFTGVVNAPNADITVAGNGTVDGALTGKTVTFSGNATLHYDTQLAAATSSSPYYYVKSWIELTEASTSSSAFKRDSRAPFTNIF